MCVMLFVMCLVCLRCVYGLFRRVHVRCDLCCIVFGVFHSVSCLLRLCAGLVCCGLLGLIVVVCHVVSCPV